MNPGSKITIAVRDKGLLGVEVIDYNPDYLTCYLYGDTKPSTIRNKNYVFYKEGWIFTHSSYKKNWIQPNSYWTIFEDGEFRTIYITFRRGSCIFYKYLMDGKFSEEDYFDANSCIARMALPKKFYIHRSLIGVPWTMKRFNGPCLILNSSMLME